ncbi:MAG: hypothetical protein LBD23_07010 [Oscillospiraceae bacterium]|nr:hypothetical protein [Oscillospiraceae bacterium]
MYLLWIVLAYMFVFVITTIKGPTIWDRLLGMTLISVKGVIFIIAYASIFDKAYMLDYAIICTLFGFISVLFIAYFITDRAKKKRK